MVEHVVDAREEQPVQDLLDLRGALAEMLVDPRARLGGHERRALHMRGGRRELGNEDVAVVPAEHLGLGDVRKGVEVEPVAGGTVRLVAREASVLAAPVGPYAEAGELRLVDVTAILRLRAVVFVAVVVERAPASAGTYTRMWKWLSMSMYVPTTTPQNAAAA